MTTSVKNVIYYSLSTLYIAQNKKEIYLLAAESIFLGAAYAGCGAIRAAVRGYLISYGVNYFLRVEDEIERDIFLLDNFPEFGLFRPNGACFGISWFGDIWCIENQEARIFALLLAAEMCTE